MDYALETENKLLKTANWLAQGIILKKIEANCKYSIRKNLEEGKKSYAVSFHFQDNESTLTDQTVDQIMEKIRKSLETEVNAQLR